MNLKISKFNPYFTRPKKLLWNSFAICGFAFLFLGMSGCSSAKKINPGILYFQKDLDSLAIVQVKENTIKLNDILSVQIFSKSLIQDQAAIFNLPDKSVIVGNDGYIEIPIIGKVKAVGLTKYRLQEAIEEKLVNYIKDPTVIVKLAQFNVSVLGEVRLPGSHGFPTEKVTLIDAIGAAGDLTDAGKREDITIIREENQVRTIYKVDLTSGTLFTSPAFLMQPNDIIYVGANVKKLRTLNTSPDRTNGLQLTSILLSLVSSATFLIYFYKNQFN
jgi:polysaccharide export outer membrane protein